MTNVLGNAFEVRGMSFTLRAATEIKRNRFLTVNANEEFVYPAEGKAGIVASMDVCDATQPMTGGKGIVIIEASVAIPAGSKVTSTASGKAKIAAASDEVCGVAVVGATGAGQFISVLL